MQNLTAELADNVKVYSDFTKSRTSTTYPAKMDVPMVWDLYMDATRPVEGKPLAAQTVEFDGDVPHVAEWKLESADDGALLSQLNDRLKTQSRRYPHPITNEMEELG